MQLNISISNLVPGAKVNSEYYCEYYCDHVLPFVPSTRTVIGSRSFRVAAPSVWNSLPQHLRADSLSQQQLKNGLKTHLFKVAYLDNSSENY